MLQQFFLKFLMSVQESSQVPCTLCKMLGAGPSSSLAVNVKALAFSWSRGKPCGNCLYKHRFAGIASKEQVRLFNNSFCS